MARVLLLDLDKTLINLEDHTDFCAGVEDARAYLGRLPTPPAVPATGWGRCALEAMQILVALADRPEWNAVSDLIEAHELIGAEKAEPMPGLRAFLDATAPTTRVVVTLCGPRSARRVIERYGVEVDDIVARGPDLAIKPAPDQVLRALDLVGAAPADAVMIGDSGWDMAAAHAAGVAFVGLTNGRATEQFGPDCPRAATLADAVPLLLSA